MNPLNKEDLEKHIKKMLNQYKKPENKNSDFKEKLMNEATVYPSSLWETWAPTKDLKYSFLVVEQKLMAQKWYDNYMNNIESLGTIVNLCYENCLVRDGKRTKKIDDNMLKQWQEVFSSVLPEFNDKFNSVVNKWQEWDSKTPQEQHDIIKNLVVQTEAFKRKM